MLFSVYSLSVGNCLHTLCMLLWRFVCHDWNDFECACPIAIFAGALLNELIPNFGQGWKIVRQRLGVGMYIPWWFLDLWCSLLKLLLQQITIVDAEVKTLVTFPNLWMFLALLTNPYQHRLQNATKNAKIPIAVNRIQYNLFTHNEETIAFCDANNITVGAYSPLSGQNGAQSGFKDETVKSIASAHTMCQRHRLRSNGLCSVDIRLQCSAAAAEH